MKPGKATTKDAALPEQAFEIQFRRLFLSKSQLFSAKYLSK
nr:hypothetical protein [uncultured Cohaesibacter sp.]